MEKRKKTTKVKKTVKRRVKRKILVSSLKERRFVVPISRGTFAAVQTTRKEFSIARAALILMLIVGPSLFGLLSIKNTIAFYNDIESSIGNIFSAASLDFTVDAEKSDNRFQTHTQGGWGSPGHGNNPGAYRDANFASAFPGGALIGDASGFTALFTDAESVKDFLPAGGTPMPFTQDHIDPISTEAGVLTGQVLALTLNVGFDLYDPNFAPSVNNLKDYVINDSSVPCDGMTVQEVLDEGNIILGGLPGSFSASDINKCATWVNEEFDGGGGDGLVPGGSITQFATILNEGTLGFQYTVKVEKTSGDDAFCHALDLEAVLEGASHYTGDLMTFVSSPVVYATSTDEWEFIISLPIGAHVHGSCSFDFVFSGWQTTLPNFGGFSDIERVDDPVYGVASVTVVSEENNRETGSGIESNQDTSPTEFVLGAEEAATPTSTEIIVDNPVLTPEITASSSSVSSELSPEPSPVVTPEPVIIEPPVEPAPLPADSPAPAQTDSISSPQAE